MFAKNVIDKIIIVNDFYACVLKFRPTDDVCIVIAELP